MRKNILLGMAVGAVLVFGSAGGAFAGERGGNGEPTQGPLHANSPCVYSGLEDGHEDPTGPSGPGVVQNWGHAKNVPGVVSVHGAAWVTAFGDEWGCNARDNGLKK
jgi:hypothetical protein